MRRAIKGILGERVKINRDFCGVPKGTEGVIDQVLVGYGGGDHCLMVAWDLPTNPLPRFYTGSIISLDVLRDAFCPDEYRYLEPVDKRVCDGCGKWLEHAFFSRPSSECVFCENDRHDIRNFPENWG